VSLLAELLRAASFLAMIDPRPLQLGAVGHRQSREAELSARRCGGRGVRGGRAEDGEEERRI
jgi:hypothetical protein